MVTIDFNIESIDVLKRMQKEKYKGWSKYLIPFCKKYFDAGLSLKFTQQELRDLYEMNVSVDTLRAIRNKYKQEANLSSPQKVNSFTSNPISTLVPKTEVKPIAPNHRQLSPQEREEKNQVLERVIKEMADFDNRPTENRTELDDLLERQQQKKLNNQSLK